MLMYGSLELAFWECCIHALHSQCLAVLLGISATLSHVMLPVRRCPAAVWCEAVVVRCVWKSRGDVCNHEYSTKYALFSNV
jgi:hypothetical protein